MKIIYFVRHGQSKSNIEKVFAGSRYDVPLTELGLAQAKAIGKMLKGRPVDVVISSPLQRSKQTAEEIVKEIGFKDDIVFQPLLKERDFGEATGEPWSSGIGERIDAGDIRDIETIEQLADRMQQLLDWLKTVPGKHVLVVGHGTAEIMLQTIYRGRSPRDFLQTPELENTEIREYVL